ncbi:MAG: hypothetical protein HY744_25275 [Deltaproteobacteria bacterium]|nr:hypothetical protein [Deltaproteobacteria bacterium]
MSADAVNCTPEATRDDGDRRCTWVRRGEISRLTCFQGFECEHCAVAERIADLVERDSLRLAELDPEPLLAGKLAA